MPVDWSKYPPNWRDLVAAVRERSGDRCECRGECGSPACHRSPCEARNGQPHPITGSRVVLTTAHLDHDTTHNDLSNLRHLCQACHLRYDFYFHRENVIKNRIKALEKAGQMAMFADEKKP